MAQRLQHVVIRVRRHRNDTPVDRLIVESTARSGRRGSLKQRKQRPERAKQAQARSIATQKARSRSIISSRQLAARLVPLEMA